jgi:hypothetical protein
MSTDNATFNQAIHLLNLIQQKGETLEEVNLLFTSGLFSDLLNSDLKKVNRKEFQKVLGLFDFIIKVDRCVRIEYPPFVREVLHPELEYTGSTEYNLAKLDLWFHDGQKNGGHMTGKSMYSYFKKTNSLESCLGYRDGLSIIRAVEESLKKEERFYIPFWKLFGQNRLYLWRSVVEGTAGKAVPYIYSSGGTPSLLLDWAWLGNYCCHSETPALRFKELPVPKTHF